MYLALLVKLSIGALCFLSLPASACRPFGSYQFVEDKNGGIWFTEGDNNAISRMAPDGSVVSHLLPTAAAEPTSLALALDGSVWFAEMDGKKIGRLDGNGRIVEFAVQGGSPFRVVVDASGEAWFTVMADHGGNGKHARHAKPSGIGRIDREGLSYFHPAPEGWPTSIAIDSRNQAWVTLLVPGKSNGVSEGRLALLSRDGQWKIITAREAYSCPGNLVPDAEGGMFYSDKCNETLVYRNARGKSSEWQLPKGTRIQSMSLSRDGKLWFTDRKNIGYFVKGKTTFVDRAESSDSMMAILVTRKGDVVFSEGYNYNINRLTKNGEYVEHLISVDTRKSVREVKEGEVCFVEFAAQIASKEKMDKQRAEEVKSGRFKPDGAGTEQLVGQKCLICHDSRRLLLSRRSDWTPSITRMHAKRDIHKFEPLTAEESTRLINYFNAYYGLKR